MVVTTKLTQVAEDMARRAESPRVLDYETPPPPRTAWDDVCELAAWCLDAGCLLTYCLGILAMAVGGGAAHGSPRLAGVLLTAAVVLMTVATVRWAYGRPARW